MRVAAASALLAAVGITALGVFVGWAMDHFILPPEGGGWRCYLACVATTWALPAGAVGLWGLPRLCRWLTRMLA